MWIAALLVTAYVAPTALGWSFHDEVLVTGHLSITSEIENGTYPPRHLSFPELELRYHYGFDLLVAADSSKNATISKSDAYSFAGPTAYAFSPNPIAATATLAANATRTVTLTATDATLHPVSGARIYLSFTQTTAGGTAWVGSKQLSITMNPFLTNSAGHITITYKASATPPATGTDTIHASNLRSGATLTASDAYTY